jgi:YVTN family beta-propeller protein
MGKNFVAIVVLAVLAGACSRQEEPSRTESPAADEPATAPTAAPAGGRLFVTNEQGGDISVVDVAAQRVIGSIPVGKRPRGIRLSPDKTLLYVALSGSPIAPPGVDEDTLPPADKSADGIGVVSVADGKLLRVIKAGSDPEQTAVSADGTRLFVANEDVGEASVVSIADGEVLGTFEVGGEPEGVDLRPDGGVVYVTSEEDNQVAVIDAVGLKLVKTFKVGARPRSTAFLPDSSKAYVTAENGGSISVVDARKHEVIRTIQLTGELVRPMGAVVARDGRHVFVSTGRGKNVVVIDTATDQPIGTVEVGERPWGIDVSPDGQTVFTANGPSNDVSIVDVASRTVKARVKVGDRPWGLVFVP